MLKLGRRPARYTRASMIRSQIVAMNFALLGPPPASSDDYVSAVSAATGGDWGMMGNDTAGDCTIADCAHQIMLRTANASTIVIPTLAQVMAVYSDISGYDPSQTDSQGDNPTDTGADELTVCNYMQRYGLAGHKIDASANLNPTNLMNLRWTVQLYGASRLGILCTDTMIDQFQNGQPWEPVDGAHVEGGHDVPDVLYVRDGLTTMHFVVTWQKLHPVTEAFLKWVLPDGRAILEENHAECASDFLKASGVAPSGLNHDQMLRELQAVQG
jgi:hypothetical protein